MPTFVVLSCREMHRLSDGTGVRMAQTHDVRADCSPGPIRVRLLIADDRARTRRALRALLGTHAEFALVGEVADGAEALTAVEQLQPNIVILDIRMPRLDGLAATRQIKARWPTIRVIAHSLAEELRADALAAGADAFVAKGAPVRQLVEALRQGASGACPDADGRRASG
jgi:SARP family transcriptional regulator, regulator of embCAB operon